MKSPLLPNTFLTETKPWINDEGMFVCVSEKWRELLKTLSKKEIFNILNNVEIFKNEQEQFSFIKKWGVLSHKWEKYFLKYTDSREYNWYEEMLASIYIKQILDNVLKNDESNQIAIEILEPLVWIFNKQTSESLIITPHIKNYISLKTAKKDWILLQQEKDNISNIINKLFKTYEEIPINSDFDIWDFLSERNIVLIKESNWNKKLILHDPLINYHNFNIEIKNINMNRSTKSINDDIDTVRNKYINLQKTKEIHQIFTTKQKKSFLQNVRKKFFT